MGQHLTAATAIKLADELAFRCGIGTPFCLVGQEKEALKSTLEAIVQMSINKSAAQREELDSCSCLL